ncbi:MAG: UDP-N-acetylmuramoyl-L-alanyl-D-glutamate--2,6-diaminopimelate ligase [Phycisphaerales bacterium]|nr:UDP-N-acetylmuramoyl-L-alanyl-D-glutamate--2,6-diaminopimelate ligase [Phycisphaerales bacterium]
MRRTIESRRLGLRLSVLDSFDDWKMIRVCDLTEDSRTVLPGSLFVARGGIKSDGRAFVAAAVRGGAVAILCEEGSKLDLAEDAKAARRKVVVLETSDVALASAILAEHFYAKPSSQLKLVGVTGTNGKTTTTWLAWRLLNLAGVRAGLVGTVVIDDGVEVAPAEMTTPPAIELSRTLSVMVESGCRAAFMEVSSHSLVQHRVGGLEFAAAAFTNLTQDHLDYHKTMDAYAAAKAMLFERLDSRATAIINTDSEFHERMTRDCRAPIIRCSTRTGDATVAILDMDRRGMRLQLRGPWGDIDTLVPLIGAFNAMNVLQAIAAAHACGLSRDQLAEGCARLDAPPGRLERVPTNISEPLVLVDYAHTDDGLRNALSTVRAVLSKNNAQSGRVIVVFGCGGDRDTGKRPKMGAVAAELADVLVITSDNPRTERPGDIIDAILSGVPAAARSKVSVQADRKRAIEFAIESANAHDIVLIAGKGHETEQLMPDGQGGVVRHHFDDREVAREAIAARREAKANRKPAAARSAP